MRVYTLIAAGFLSLVTGYVLAFPVGVVMSDAGALADSKKMTLYTFENVHEGVSSCSPGASADGNYISVKRGDGNEQWAFKGISL